MALGGEAFKWQARLIPDICPRINAATKYLIVGIARENPAKLRVRSTTCATFNDSLAEWMLAGEIADVEV